jgi:hypothetical protein
VGEEVSACSLLPTIRRVSPPGSLDDAAWCLPGRHPGILGNAEASSSGIGTLAFVPLSDRCSQDMTPSDGRPSL